MKKISYRNKKIEIMKKLDPKDLPSVHVREEGLSGDTSSGVGRGFALPGEPVMPPMHSDQEDKPIFLKRKERKFKSIDYGELLDYFVNLGDDLDHNDELALANFTDFLIKKVATQKSLDYSLLFRDLLIKIVESDLNNQEEVLIEVTRQFNEFLKMHIELGAEVKDAKREAYQSSVSRAKKYVEADR